MPPVPAVAAGMTYLTIECAVKAYVSRTKRDQGDIMKSLIGVLALDHQQVRGFSERQIELATSFADQAVIVIENARLFEEARLRNRELTETLDQQTATSTILRAIAASPTDVQPVLDTVIESATRLCSVHRTTACG